MVKKLFQHDMNKRFLLYLGNKIYWFSHNFLWLLSFLHVSFDSCIVGDQIEYCSWNKNFETDKFTGFTVRRQTRFNIEWFFSHVILSSLSFSSSTSSLASTLTYILYQCKFIIFRNRTHNSNIRTVWIEVCVKQSI